VRIEGTHILTAALAEIRGEFLPGRCDAYSTDTSALAAFGFTAPVVAVPESWRLRLRQAHPFATQAARYTIVGALGTAANAVIFLALRTWWEALAANLAALVLSTLLVAGASFLF